MENLIGLLRVKDILLLLYIRFIYWVLKPTCLDQPYREYPETLGLSVPPPQLVNRNPRLASRTWTPGDPISPIYPCQNVWTSYWTLWGHPLTHHSCSWPVSAGLDYAAFSYQAGLADPTAGQGPRYCAQCNGYPGWAVLPWLPQGPQYVSADPSGISPPRPFSVMKEKKHIN